MQIMFTVSVFFRETILYRYIAGICTETPAQIIHGYFLCGILFNARIFYVTSIPTLHSPSIAIESILFLFALGFLKWPIGRRRLVGVLRISVNPLLQFLGTPLQL